MSAGAGRWGEGGSEEGENGLPVKCVDFPFTSMPRSFREGTYRGRRRSAWNTPRTSRGGSRYESPGAGFVVVLLTLTRWPATVRVAEGGRLSMNRVSRLPVGHS